MHSVHQVRIAMSCATLMLCGLTRLAAAQTPDTPFFAQDLTRASLGSIPNLDDQVTAEARMAPDGHMIITGNKTEVWMPAGKYIELVPKLQVAGFTPVTLSIFENGQRIKTYGLEQAGELPMLRIDPPTGASNKKFVQIAVFDAQNKPRTLMECTMRARIADPNPAALTAKSAREQCNFEIDARQTLAATYVYLGDIYMGILGEKASKFQINERCLPPGVYSCQMVTKNAEGILIPGTASSFTIQPRYTIACVDTVPTPDGIPNIVVPEHADDAKLKITVSRRADAEIVKTQVYIAGILAGEQKGENFTLDLPLKDVPTGVNPIEVLGVGADGTIYPVESISVKIENKVWDQHIANTSEYQSIVENLPKIKEQARLVGYWLTRAENEPDTVHVSTTKSHFPTYSEIKEMYAPGHAAEYKANAKHALLLMTQLELETGKLYRKLKMRTKAKNMFYRVVQELGTQTDDGKQAQAQLEVLTKETRHQSVMIVVRT